MSSIDSLGITRCFVIRYIETSVDYEDDDVHCIERVFLYLEDAMNYCLDMSLSIYKNDLKYGERVIEFKPITSQNRRYTRTYYVEEYDLFY